MGYLDGRTGSRSASPSRRDELLRTAAELFAARGFHGVTMGDIGAVSGVSGPALYHHFSSKESLLDEMLTSISEALLDNGRTITRFAADPVSAVEGLLRAQVAFALDETDLITVQDRDLVHLSEAARRRVRRLQRSYVELWVAQLALHPRGAEEHTVRAAVHATIGLINSTPHSARIGRGAMEALLLRMARGALAAALAEVEESVGR